MRHTRRSLLLGGGALAGALLGTSVAPARAPAQGIGDPAILFDALRLEQAVALGYDLALARGLLRGRALALVRSIGAHEHEHVAALVAKIQEIKGPLPPHPRGLADVDAAAPGLGAARTEHALLSFLLELEAVNLYGLYLGVQQLDDQKMVQTATSIMGCEGQHLVMLRLQLGLEPLPVAEETGSVR